MRPYRQAPAALSSMTPLPSSSWTPSGPLPGATPCSRLITRRLIERFLRQLVLASPGSKPLHQALSASRRCWNSSPTAFPTRDRGAAIPDRGHRQDPRGAHLPQARPPRPCPSRRLRPRSWPAGNTSRQQLAGCHLRASSRTDTQSTGMRSDTAVQPTISGMPTTVGPQIGCSDVLFRFRTGSALKASFLTGMRPHASKRDLGPHPYQLNAGNRCAERRFCRSRPTVGGEVTGSIGRQLRVLLQTAASPAGLSRCSGASWRSAGSRRSRYLIPKQTGLRLDPERYLRYYNTERAHTGRWTKGRTQQRSSGRPSCGTSNADASRHNLGIGHSGSSSGSTGDDREAGRCAAAWPRDGDRRVVDARGGVGVAAARGVEAVDGRARGLRAGQRAR
jgi:hypothetical protein